MIVGEAVADHTRDDFDWSTVAYVLNVSGKAKMHEGIILHFAALYPLGVERFLTPPGERNVKAVARDLARSAIWIEALTFLDNEGYAECLKK